MSSHSIKIDVQEVAYCVRRIQKELDLIDYIFQQSLMEESNGKTDGERKEREEDKPQD